MKQFFFLIALVATVFSACGPAAENREVMHSRAKVFQDSIANMIRVSMDEAATPAPGWQAPPAAAAPAPAAAAPAPAPGQQPNQQVTPTGTPGK